MQLSRLTIEGVRNLQQVRLDSLSRINVFYGANGSGKTSVLEAIHLLATTRSFRQAPLKSQITWGQQHCLIYGEGVVSGHKPVKLGVKRAISDSNLIKVDGQHIRSAAQLAQYLPILVLDSEIFRLISGGPVYRRRFMDWGVFHVEHDYQSLWLNMEKSLKQRNSVLRRDRIDGSLLDVWTKQFVEYSEQIDALRARFMEGFTPYFHQVLNELIDLDGIELRYSRGWDQAAELKAVLDRQRQVEIDRKHTVSGPHRADIKIRYKGNNADDVLSRGQQKLVSCALKIAQGLYFEEVSGKMCTFLVDDLPAELDVERKKRLFDLLDRLSGQLFVTCTELSELTTENWISTDARKLFHVEHGAVSGQ